MPRTLCLHPDHKATVLQALERNRFLTQGDLAAHLEVARSTVSKFINGRPVYVSKFEAICDVLGLEARDVMNPDAQSNPPKRSKFSGFQAYDDCWVGRFDYTTKEADFVSTAIRWLDGLGVAVPPGQTQPEPLRDRLLDYLEAHPVLLSPPHSKPRRGQSDLISRSKSG